MHVCVRKHYTLEQLMGNIFSFDNAINEGIQLLKYCRHKIQVLSHKYDRHKNNSLTWDKLGVTIDAIILTYFIIKLNNFCNSFNLVASNELPSLFFFSLHSEICQKSKQLFGDNKMYIVLITYFLLLKCCSNYFKLIILTPYRYYTLKTIFCSFSQLYDTRVSYLW